MLRMLRRPVPREPAHPGAVLRLDVIPALRLTVAETASRLGVSRQALYTIQTGRGRVTEAMASRLGELCGNGPEIWLNMQRVYDLWAKQRNAEAKKKMTGRARTA
jgi:antitoxin HigA-1